MAEEAAADPDSRCRTLCPAACRVKPGELPKGHEFQILKPCELEAVEGFDRDNPAPPGARSSKAAAHSKKMQHGECAVKLFSPCLRHPPGKRAPCARTNFSPWQATNPDGGENGLITGYYEPLLRGSRVRSERYRYPLYTRPDDLVSVELAALYPELANRSLRGRISGNKLMPYYSRGEIEIALRRLRKRIAMDG